MDKKKILFIITTINLIGIYVESYFIRGIIQYSKFLSKRQYANYFAGDRFILFFFGLPILFVVNALWCWLIPNKKIKWFAFLPFIIAVAVLIYAFQFPVQINPADL